MKELNYEEFTELCQELILITGGKYDGSKRNIIVPECPWCGKDGYKFGIYVGKPSGNRVQFMSNCFSCGQKNRDLKPLLYKLGRLDLYPSEVTEMSYKIKIDDAFKLNVEEEDEHEMFYCNMPNGYARVYFDKYLKGRGFTSSDYEYFEVGTTRSNNYKFTNYIIFPIFEDREPVGYVARHIWSKDKIDEYNRVNKPYVMPRYKNSTEEEANDFQHLIYNIDAVIDGTTNTVILVEGVFDCIALTRKLKLYDRNDIVVCATFGKQITPTKMEKIQQKGVSKIILGYDGDAAKYNVDACNLLDEYFDVLVADIEDDKKDWDDLDVNEIVSIFANNLLSPVEYNYKKIKI